MSNHADMDKFLAELEKLMHRHKVKPAVIVFHPPNTDAITMGVALIGNPSIDWCVGAGQMYFNQLSKLVTSGKITSNRIDPNFGKPIEVPSNIILPRGVSGN